MATVAEVGPRLGIALTCAALGLPRATYYRRQRPHRAPAPGRSPRALGAEERVTILAANDEEAKERAKQLADVHAVELWLEGRKIATFEPEQ
jgi:alkanesulfonate monooxygenase SsuD/methylene tetrahydromethanopterin reductase-like flavin-dependent oxidoreductase (luciferase family)